MREKALKATFVCVLVCAAIGVVGCATAPTPPSCNRQSAGHGLVATTTGATTCTMNSDCNSSAKPTCAAPMDNTCLCTARDNLNQCTAGQCVWHVDPAITTCVCVPGQVQRCIPSGGSTPTGYQECASTGATWGICTAASSPAIPAVAPAAAPAAEGEPTP